MSQSFWVSSNWFDESDRVGWWPLGDRYIDTSDYSIVGDYNRIVNLDIPILVPLK